jgi:stage V sporulation protein R
VELLDQKNKKIMEECNVRAKAEGLNIKGETLEYIVTNRDLLELQPKVMIPTLYDYWVHDIDTIRSKWIYDVNPHNPFETVINTRPPLSFYNDNNPDWLNIMIFYHVLGHIDLFQNNVFFKNTWANDFCGEALADKRIINRIREELGTEKRQVDYVIEFAKSLDNLVGYYEELEGNRTPAGISNNSSEMVDFYFGKFLKQHHDDKNIQMKFYYDELDRLNTCRKLYGEAQAEAIFFNDQIVRSKFPEFNSFFKKQKKEKKAKPKDILQYLIEESEFINKSSNHWMKDVLAIIRKTSLYFQPQIRTKIINEGWASLWHDRLFLSDPRISSHEVDYSKINSRVLADHPIGLNPYIIGKRLLEFIEELGEKGKLSYEYQMIQDRERRKHFDKKLGKEAGKQALFDASRNYDDAMLINCLSDDDFQDFVDKHKLFVVGQRLNPEKMTNEIYIRSRDGREYRKMLKDHLYHPPYIFINENKATEGELYLDHSFEGRTLVSKYVPAVLGGLSYLSGRTVKLETTEFSITRQEYSIMMADSDYKPSYKKLRVLYARRTNGGFERTVLSETEEGG